MGLFKSISDSRWILQTIWFNFHYLPFKQAIKLPISLRKPKLLSCKGQIRIEGKVHKGMIRLGDYEVSLYPDTGIVYENHGGTIIFKGGCRIGGDSAMSIGSSSTVVFGGDFVATASLKLVSYIGIEFGQRTRVGWNSLIMDTNFHPLYDMEHDRFKRAYGRIKIGDFNWFGNQCVVMHSVETPERCIFGLRSVVTRSANFESYAVHGGSPIKVISRNVMRVYGKDLVKEYI